MGIQQNDWVRKHKLIIHVTISLKIQSGYQEHI